MTIDWEALILDRQERETHSELEQLDLCPICGALISLRHDTTKDGRLIGSCGDAFTIRQWEEEE